MNNSMGDLVKCKIILEDGLTLNRILNSSAPIFDEICSTDCIVLRFSPSDDGLFDLKFSVPRSSVCGEYLF